MIARSQGEVGVTEPVDLLVHSAVAVCTVDSARLEISGGWVSVRDGLVAAVGAPGQEPPARKKIDATGCLVTPGLVNAHHHFWQNLTRSYTPMTTTDFLGWLTTLYPLWSSLDEEGTYLSARVALAELALGGCTTTADHLYLQPPHRGSLLDAQLTAAHESGLRLTATRGIVDRGQRDGSPMPDHLLEDLDTALADCERAVATHHDRSPTAKIQIALGPHSVFGSTTALMRDTAELAERIDVRLHTHLSGDVADDGYCLDLHGMRPVDWFESTGWMSARTWVAHCLFPDETEVKRLGTAGVGVAQCSTAALLMGLGVAPAVALRRAGSPVGIGVDGSANSDTSSMWLETRTTMLANRLKHGPAAYGARDALEQATRGGAACLGRTGEIGELSVGANADIAIWPLSGIPWAGAISDPVDAWLRCGPSAPRHLLVGGEPAVTDGQLLQDDLELVLARHERVARRMQKL